MKAIHGGRAKSCIAEELARRRLDHEWLAEEG
jgi:hypothetical protein